ncbi:hypothetical protein [uncultured Roseibium sp.]|uniref:hypothetical protein n=1 Tax=uncultured Roseibium sp. TaxID=1936171 RepID=UPI002606AD01|nr:hypothetical protein [uncultured Roseibium sp.]
MRKLLNVVFLASLFAALSFAAHAGKGDRLFQVPKSAPLLQGKTLDLRFAEFAQGIWVRELENCPVPRVDRSEPGSALVIYRGLLETPGRICQVYGAERSGRMTQRAAINCLSNDGGESIELVTVQPRGSDGLLVQEGEKVPVHFRFCRKIIPILQSQKSN